MVNSKKRLYESVLAWFEANMPEAESELVYRNIFELIVAVMLSAQCTDKRVNMVTPSLFSVFPNARSMAHAEVSEIFSLIKSISYPNAKAQHLRDMATMLEERFQGEVPHTMDELMGLPGVGRKTANVVLAVGFGFPAMPVDTHVFRVANRLGLVKTTTPEETERELVKHIPSEILSKAHHWLLLHGRYVCKSLKPQCTKCGLASLCKNKHI